MPAYAVIGGQWGDEGKGKVVDLLSADAHVVARFNGGNNAGHTVITAAGEFKFHLIPAGILRPDCTCIIGNGVVVNPDAFLEEVSGLTARDVSVERLFISHKTQVIMPYHTMLDGLEEEIRAESGKAIGTTGMGIGPAYMDKAARTGIRMVDLLDEKALLRRLGFVLEQKNAVITKLYGREPLSLEEVYERCLEWGRGLKPYIRPVEPMLQQAFTAGQRVILEGAQGTLLDVDHGTYPYVTSSSPTVGGACTGLGISPRHVQAVAGVYKAYTTRVGGGPLPTELDDEVGEFIRQRAWEYGTTTGRPRRCGWFDAVAARYSASINGVTSAILTRLDVLDGISPVRLCVAYRLRGETISEFPPDAASLEECEPVYEELPGWEKATASARSMADLPAEATSYLSRIQELIGCSIDMVSTGPSRDEAIILRPIF